MIAGDTSALSLPYTVVLTESTARKYYGEEDPIGRTLRLGDEAEFEIRGVIKDVPENSHLKFSALVSAETLHQMTDGASRNAWGWYDFNTYVLLKEGTDPQPSRRNLLHGSPRRERRIGEMTALRNSFFSLWKTSTFIPISFRSQSPRSKEMQIR